MFKMNFPRKISRLFMTAPARIGILFAVIVLPLTQINPSLAERVVGDPVQVIQSYYRALSARDYAGAYALWGHDGADSGKSFEDFQKGFADTRSTAVDVGIPGAPDGAAGSTFVTVPVTVTATTNDGKYQRFVGSYTVRRVNDVPGATASQLAWHIQTASLRIAPIAQTTPAEGIKATYRCDDGSAIAASFVNAPAGPGKVQLTIGAESLTLPQALSADGGRYADGSTEFWTKGSGATFTRGGKAISCETTRR